jgi:hypothetical protein
MIPVFKPTGMCTKCRRDVGETEVVVLGMCAECVKCKDVFDSIDNFELDPCIRDTMCYLIDGSLIIHGPQSKDFKDSYQHTNFVKNLWLEFPEL